MKLNKHIIMIYAVIIFCLSGCSFSSWKASTVSVSTVEKTPADISINHNQERRFAGALEFLREGKEQEARDLLEIVIAGHPRSGVTDEALFRLSLLCLRDEGSKGSAHAQELLERLISEFPYSIWAYQGSPLAAYLAGIKTLRDKQREMKSLREQNLSLSRDNRELRQSIERLKSLDLELENKTNR